MEGTAEERRSTYLKALSYFPHLKDGVNIRYEDSYMITYKGGGTLVSNTSEVGRTLQTLNGGMNYGSTQTGTNFITIFRGAVVPFRGNIALPKVRGPEWRRFDINGLQNAIMTIGHENHHRDGFEFDNDITHIYSNKAGLGVCVASGNC